MNRQSIAQGLPPDDLDLSDFPPTNFAGYLFRAHRRDRGAWYFSNSGEGRFDLIGDRGTCYLADTVAAAVRERVGEQFVNSRAIAPEDARNMVVSELEVDMRHVADLNSPGVALYPITAELTSMEDYRIPQAWARVFDGDGDGDGFGGVRYSGRFSYAVGDSYAEFGPAGPDASRFVVDNPMDGFEACAKAGITVLPEPPTDLVGLTIVTP